MPDKAHRIRFRVLGAISFSHFLNDMIQSLILAIYPLLKGKFQLTFAQIGLITLTYQVTASLLQPLVGFYTDRNPKPYSLAFGMVFTLIGLLVLAAAPNYGMLLLAAGIVGTGSSIFHPESSRVARMASGGQHGLAHEISKSAAIQDQRWARYLLRGLSFRKVNKALPGFRWPLCWLSGCCGGLAAGIVAVRRLPAIGRGHIKACTRSFRCGPSSCLSSFCWY